ncbi:MAG: DNA repair protein RadA [Dethiobacter sp.]|jgi:DNA repair protein RadA/Sms|nr:MAG: DNA repair protein RadA [Dethiobacter sp.]
MPKRKVIFVCQQCGYEAHKWMGRCPNCQSWSTMLEESFQEVVPENISRLGEAGDLKQLDQIESLDEERFLTGIKELDRVLGGGAVAGTVILVGGDPGIGKSTLLLQAALGLASRDGRVLYVTGEESPGQVKMRAKRLSSNQVPLMVLAETEYNRIANHITKYNPQVVIVDSIQTIMKGELGNVPGSVVQVREITASLVQLAKNKQIIFFIVGHVTKEGILAGPRLLEHMVDCVLYFEGERYQNFRILRGVKNRFGATNEIGIFTMESSGLQEVQNPSALFLNQRPTSVAGSVVVPIMEGSRPLLVEIQGLATPSYFGGTPRRTSTGLDSNRVAIIIAVLEKRAGMKLYNCDIFINVVGGVRIMEPAADLGVALSIASSLMDKPIQTQIMMVGEIGLTGEVRPVNRMEERLREGAKMGFNRCILPRGNMSRTIISNMKEIEKDLEMIGVSTLAQALNLAFI